MLVHRGEDSDQMEDATMAKLFQKHLVSIDNWLQEQKNFQVLHVNYSEILSDPVTQVQAVNVFLGGGLDVQAMAEQVDPALYRNRNVG